MKYIKETKMWKLDSFRNFDKTEDTKLNTTIIQNGKIHNKEATKLWAQSAFSWLKLTIETLEQSVKRVQS